MSVATIAVLTLLLLFFLFFMGLEIGFSMAIAGLVGYAVVVSPQAALNLLAVDIVSVFSSYGLIVIPLFILMGQFGAGAGIPKNLYVAAYRFFGRIPGGLAIGTVAAATAFKAVCGSSIATAATFAAVAIPEMDKYGYDKKLSTGTVATVGTLGVVMPPSVAMIIYGLLTETSIGKLFLAGIIPGLMIAATFVVTIYAWCKINPLMGPRSDKSFTWRERLKAIPPVILVLVLFVVIVGGLMFGFFTPTEAGSIGAFAVLLLVLATKDISMKGFANSVLDSMRIACMTMTLMLGATILGHFFAVTKAPYLVAEFLGQLPIDRAMIMIIIVLAYLVGGSFIEDMAFLILATPIFFPLAMKLGYDPVWFGVIVMVTNMIGIILPPMAINVFVVSGISKVPVGTVYKGIYPYIIGMSLCLLLLIFVPEISLWLPNLLMR